MCIYNHSIYTNSRLIYPSSNQLLKSFYKCGYCFECVSQKIREYSLRGYYQGLETIDKGGYMIFDTLTYADEHAPKINDVLNVKDSDNFFCFRNIDIVHFFNNFRIKLKRMYNETSTLSYLVSGEYGTSDNGTHRPHYHILVFYTGKCKPNDLSLLISTTWKFGRTDGIFYKGESYFKNKRLFTSMTNFCLNIVKYVVKYMEKETKYSKTINERINKLIIDKFNSPYKYLTYYDKLEAQKIAYILRQYQRISNNFGSYYLNFHDDKTLFNNKFLIKIPDTKNIVTKCYIPLYYRRKLYYNLVYYSFNGNVLSKWVLNERGKLFYKNLLDYTYNQNLTNIKNKIVNYNFNNNDTLVLKDNEIIKLAKYVTYQRFRYLNDYTIIDINKNLFNFNSNPIKSYNTRESRFIHGQSLTEIGPIQKLPININNEYEIILNLLDNCQLYIKKLQQKRHTELKELKDRYKALGIL